MRWPSAAPDAAAPVGDRERVRRSGPAAAPVGERRRARRAGPAAVGSPLEARRVAEALEDPAVPPGVRPVPPDVQVLDRVAAVVPAAVGAAGLPARGPRGDQASKVEPRRPDVRRSDRVVARRPADEHLPAYACPPEETMDAGPPSRVRQSARGGMPRRRERRPRCVASLQVPIVTPETSKAEFAARRS